MPDMKTPKRGGGSMLHGQKAQADAATDTTMKSCMQRMDAAMAEMMAAMKAMHAMAEKD